MSPTRTPLEKKTPVLLNKAGLALMLGRDTKTALAYVKKGLAPQPYGSLMDGSAAREGKKRILRFLWDEESVTAFYDRLHDEQAALVPASAQAQEEFDAFGVYACPADRGGFIGLARPVLLGLKRSGGENEVDVYRVRDVVTDGALALGPPAPVLADLRAGREDDGPLTAFLLGKKVGTFRHLAPLRQGRSVKAATLRAALERGEVADITWGTQPEDLES